MKAAKLIWFGLWILSIVGISFYGGAVSYGLFFALTLLPVVSFLYLLCVLFLFKVYQEVNSRNMICGQPMPYYFILRNESFFGFAGIKVKMFPDFSFVANIAEDTEYELLPGDEFRYETSLTCKYRGEYEVGVKEVIVTDFFKIFRISYRIPGTIRAIVHPRLVELTEVIHIARTSTTLQQETTTCPATPDVVVRDYISGDSPNRIHWKATARTQMLKVRKDIDEAKQEITILLDTKRYSKRIADYLPLESKLLETVLALGLFFAKNNARSTVYYGENGPQKSTLTNMQSFEAFYAKMSHIIFRPSEHPALLLEECLQRGLLQHTKILICVFHTLDDTIIQLADRIASEETSVVLYVITEENMDHYLKENTSRRRVIIIPTEAELEGLL